MHRFADGHGCRMLHLVRHFGDLEDSGEPGGVCDVCAAGAQVLQELPVTMAPAEVPRPQALLAVPGVGPALAARHGAQILEVVAGRGA